MEPQSIAMSLRHLQSEGNYSLHSRPAEPWQGGSRSAEARQEAEPWERGSRPLRVTRRRARRYRAAAWWTALFRNEAAQP
jgi:hypothetical protein